MTFTLCAITFNSSLTLNVSSPMVVVKAASKIDWPKLPKILLKFPSFNSLTKSRISNTSLETSDSNCCDADRF